MLKLVCILFLLAFACVASPFYDPYLGKVRDSFGTGTTINQSLTASGTNGIQTTTAGVISLLGYSDSAKYYLGTDTAGTWGSYPLADYAPLSFSQGSETVAFNAQLVLTLPPNYAYYRRYITITGAASGSTLIDLPSTFTDSTAIPVGTTVEIDLKYTSDGAGATIALRPEGGNSVCLITTVNDGLVKYYRILCRKTAGDTWVNLHAGDRTTNAGFEDLEFCAGLRGGGLTFSSSTLNVTGYTSSASYYLGTNTAGTWNSYPMPATTSQYQAGNFWLTPEGGMAVKMTCTETLVLGEVVDPSPTTDGCVTKADINSDDPVGVVYANTSSGSAAWVVVGGIGYVLPLSTATATRGYIMTVGSEAGRVDQAATIPVAAIHNREVGHFIETGTAAGAAAKAIIHFN